MPPVSATPPAAFCRRLHTSANAALRTLACLRELLCRGLANKEIADELLMSDGRLKVYLCRIFRKFNVKKWTEVIVAWMNLQQRSEGWCGCG
jgi:DNA-binding CsgD family transcriptional regulator